MAESSSHNKKILIRLATRHATRLAIRAAIIIACAHCAALANWNAGMPGAIWRPSAGAWSSAMGGAAAADPAFMLAWYNPSQLALLRERRASFGVGMRSLGRAEAWSSYDFRVPPRVGMGVSLVYRGDPFISGLYDGYYDFESGSVVEERPLGDASWNAVAVKIGAGYLVSRKLTLGGSLAINYQSLPTTVTEDADIENTTLTSIGSIDIAGTYRFSQSFTASAIVRNLLARNSWQILSYEGFSPAIDETVPPIFLIATSHKTTLLERDFMWNADVNFFFLDSEGDFAEHPELSANIGAQWDFTTDIALRAGIGDIEHFADGFSPRFTIGFSFALPKIHSGAKLNYALMTDRIWASVDQQLDITISF